MNQSAVKLLLFLCVLGMTSLGNVANAQEVRFYYMVSADRQERADYREAIENAAWTLHQWFFDQSGETFAMSDPIVEVVHSEQNAAWFNQQNNSFSSNPRVFGFFNARAELQRINSEISIPILGGNFVDVVYNDAITGGGAGAPGFVHLPVEDLEGLLGNVDGTTPNRWIGGLGHELGHGFDLRHPDQSRVDAGETREAVQFDIDHSLMGNGFVNFEEGEIPTYLNIDDLDRIENGVAGNPFPSNFFSASNLRQRPSSVPEPTAGLVLIVIGIGGLTQRRRSIR